MLAGDAYLLGRLLSPWVVDLEVPNRKRQEIKVAVVLLDEIQRSWLFQINWLRPLGDSE